MIIDRIHVTKSMLMIRANSLKHLIMLSGLLVLICFISCDPSRKFKDLEEEEKLTINNFLVSNDTLDFELKASGLYYLDIEVGTGPQAEIHDTAFMFYTMKFLSGQVFESNEGTEDTLIFPVNEGWLSVAGFDEGVTYMKEGGKAMFLVPSSLAYGSSGTYYIPSYTPLLFNTELVKLVKYSGRK